MGTTPFAFVALLISGTASAYTIGAVSVATFFAADRAQYLLIMPQRVFAQLDMFSCMAMPLFILTVEIMTREAVTRSLIAICLVAGMFMDTLGIPLVWISVLVPVSFIIILIHRAARRAEAHSHHDQTDLTAAPD